MPFVNRTPLSAELFEQLNPMGTMNGVVSARGTFVFEPNQRLSLDRRQVPFIWEDTYVGDPLTTPLLTATDLAPFKPGTDITFLGSSHAPGGQPQRDWSCGISIAGALDKRLRVTGPRYWIPHRFGIRRWPGSSDSAVGFRGWDLGEPEPATETPICWTQAFGGTHPAAADGSRSAKVHPDNPLGVGWLDPETSPKDSPLPAPRIEHPDDPIVDWQRLDHVPQGLAPVSPWWEVRRKYMGTIDDAWLENRHPLMPENFDYSFWQSAHPDCVVRPWLIGSEVVTLTNLHPQHATLNIGLPQIALGVTLEREGRPTEQYPAFLDGVHLDFRPGVEKVFLTWRAGFPWPDSTGTVTFAGGPHG